MSTAEENSSNVGNVDSDDEEPNVGDDEEPNVGDDEDPNVGDLERFMTDDSKVPPPDRTHQMLTLCSLYIPGFTTDILPFNHKIFDRSKKVHKPSRTAMLTEISRRIPDLNSLLLVQFQVCC
jgi:hypothetical protein